MAAFIVTNNDNEKTNSRVQTALGIQTLTVSDKALLTCTSLLADDNVKCKTAIIGDMTISGNIIFVNPQVWNQCITIQADGTLCCPLTVTNTEVIDPLDPQSTSLAVCVNGNTQLKPANGVTRSTNGGAVLQIAANNIVDGNGAVFDIEAHSMTTGFASELY